VYLEESKNINRKTKYDLIAVYKDDELINIDSQAPNKVFAEWVRANFSGVTLLKSEVTHGDSRFDFYLETDKERIFIEVKGVTLEQDGAVLFPDAPTERGVKHLRGLKQCVAEGYGAMVVFIVQMEHAEYFMANRKMHPAFADALKEAKEAGVTVLALKCRVSSDEIVAIDHIPVKI
jgi:sugar fermentation stimulation protein A